jgi:hypothetical protein
MELFVRKCMALQLRGFKPQELANIINGEHRTGVIELVA